MQCPKCGSRIGSSSRFCSRCGAPVDLSSAGTAVDVDSDPIFSSDSLEMGQFAPGTIYDERYRIVGLLGKGGMGEVYRAEDLKLRQPVALKFIAPDVASDPAWLSRFYNEVRLAREVTHPNVCRVHDIGQKGGLPYLSMEYIDGEDLSSLLRRIGRVPFEKGVEIARQICAGLQAAHEKGVVHRDLKPANIMVDGKGRVKITDFGLAILPEDAIRTEAAGTPVYMAPEQLQGKQVTVQSDLYSMGLVLYEIFSGQRFHQAKTFEDLTRVHQANSLYDLEESVSQLRPEVAAAIQPCLNPDPAQRPRSALQVASALPGGDPLTAALMAGETPSPEIVAAAAPDQAVAGAKLLIVVLLATLLSLAPLGWMLSSTRLVAHVGTVLSPEVLKFQARDFLVSQGLEVPFDEAAGFGYYGVFLDFLKAHDPSQDRWGLLSEFEISPLLFWFRGHSDHLIPRRGSSVNIFDPPQNQPGMTYLLFDSAGQLVRFEKYPDQARSSSELEQSPDWIPFFEKAQLNADDFETAEPTWNPPFMADRLYAWEGKQEVIPGARLQVEAASLNGQPVRFHVLGPWVEPPAAPTPGAGSVWTKVEIWTDVIFFFCLLLVSAGLAYWNVSRGKGDQTGANRLILFFVAIHVFRWILGTHHVVAPREFDLFLNGFRENLFEFLMVWLLYLGLEPYVRRFWPETLISWTGVLRGRILDAIVGRDLLYGVLTGIIAAGLLLAFPVFSGILELPPPEPAAGETLALMGYSATLVVLLEAFTNSVLEAAVLLFIMMLLRLFLKKDWLALVATIILFTLVGPTVNQEAILVSVVFNACAVTAVALCTKWLGLLATTVAFFMVNSFLTMAAAPGFPDWYTGAAMLPFGVAAALALFGFLAVTRSRTRRNPLMSRSPIGAA